MDIEGSPTTPPAAPSRASALAGLVLAFAWPLVLWIPGLSTHQITNVRDDVVGTLIKWLVVALLAGIAFGVQKRRPADLGLRPLGGGDVVAAIGAFAVALVLGGVAGRLVSLPSSVTDLQKLAAVPLSLRIVVVLTAALTEEFTYRGFGIEELALFTGRRWIAGALSLVLFTVSHAGLYGASAALLVPGLVGAVLTALYLWRRNLGSCALMHAIMDGLFVVLLPSLAHPR